MEMHLEKEADQKSQNVWERFQVIWLIYGWVYVIGVAILFWLQQPQASQTGYLFALWCLWLAGLMFWERPPRDRQSRSLMFYMLPGFGLWIFLSWQMELFFSLMGVLFPSVFRLLTFKRAAWMVASLGLGWAFIASQRYQVPALEAYVIAFVFLGGGITLGWFMSLIIGQSLTRQDLIVRLRETQEALAASERKAGRLEERQRLASEIHDTLAQNFTSVITHLEAAEAALERGPTDLQSYLQTAKKVAKEGLVQTRNRVWTLRPDLEQHMPLDASLRRIGEAWSQEHGVAVACHITGKPFPLPAEIEALFRRCLRECLLNILKHAQATRVDWTLSYMDQSVALDMVDNGAGFDIARPASGYGLAAMAHAVRTLGGEWAVESAPGEGVAVAVKIPVEVLGGNP